MFNLFASLLWLADPVSFQAALEQAAASPVVQVAEGVAKRRRAEAKGMSRLTANPTLQVQSGGRRMSTGGTGAELYLGVNQRLSLGGFGKKRRDSVSRESEQDVAMASVARQRVRLAVAEAWHARWTAQESLVLAEGEERLAHELEQRIAQTLTAGEATRVDLAVAAAWRAEAAMAVLAAEGDGFQAGVDLAHALGRAVLTPQPVLTDLPRIDLPAQVTMQATLDSVERAPRVAAAQAERASEQARLEEVTAARSPQLSVGALGWREGAGDLAAVLTLEVEIPVFERGQRERASQAAALARADGTAIETGLLAQSERVLALHEVEHTQQVLEAVEQKLLVAAEALADAQRIRLEAREGTAQEWVLARRAVLNAKLNRVRARAAQSFARFVAQELWQTPERAGGGAPVASQQGSKP